MQEKKYANLGFTKRLYLNDLNVGLDLNAGVSGVATILMFHPGRVLVILLNAGEFEKMKPKILKYTSVSRTNHHAWNKSHSWAKGSHRTVSWNLCSHWTYYQDHYKLCPQARSWSESFIASLFMVSC